jgi:hypothetical protein
MDPVDDNAYQEGFEQAYRAVKGPGVQSIPLPRQRTLIPGRTPFQCGLLAGFRAAGFQFEIWLTD